jgi:DNA-directed RNA polymerase specialized sigma24 family protein
MQNELVEIVQKIIDGSDEDYLEQVHELLYKKIRHLVKPIFKDEQECDNVTGKILRNLYFEFQTLEDTEDLYNWIYTYVTVETYSMYVRTHGKMFHSTTRSTMHYKYKSFKDDRVLKETLEEKRSKDREFSKKLMSKLSPRKNILYELYCMEDCSIEDICEMLRVDKKIIQAKVGELREFIIAFDSTDTENSTPAASDSDGHTPHRHSHGGHSHDERSHVTKKDRIIAYVFIGIFIIVGAVSGAYKQYEARFTPTIYKKNYETVYDGMDYSLVYDYNYYRWKYDDIDEKFGDDDDAALQHFVNFGMSEGRQAIATFDPIVYRDNNPDVKAVYGDNTPWYYLHYIKGGYLESRKTVE